MKIRKKIIRYTSILLIFVIILANFFLYTTADNTKIAQIDIIFNNQGGEVLSTQVGDYVEYDCSAIIKVSSKESVSGIRFKLYHNKAFKFVATENLEGDNKEENLDDGIFAITWENPKNFSSGVNIYKVYLKKKFKQNDIAINSENLDLGFDFSNQNENEIIITERKFKPCSAR